MNREGRPDEKGVRTRPPLPQSFGRVHYFSKKIKRLCIKIPIHVGSKACSLVLKKNDSTVQSMINTGPPPLEIKKEKS